MSLFHSDLLHARSGGTNKELQPRKGLSDLQLICAVGNMGSKDAEDLGPMSALYAAMWHSGARPRG